MKKLDEIYDLEQLLLSPGVRASADDLEALLADEFVEIGGSGRIYYKEDILRSLPGEKAVQFTVSDFETKSLSANLFLATYRLEKILEDGGSTLSMRSSIWKSSDSGWRMIFHQGTRIENPQ
jgi:hypothetical protein